MQRKDIGGADETDTVPVPAIQYGGESNDLVASGLGNALASFGGKPVKKLVPRPTDGLVRETNEKRIFSREEIKERTEVEDVAHLGDFSDEVSLFKFNQFLFIFYFIFVFILSKIYMMEIDGYLKQIQIPRSRFEFHVTEVCKLVLNGIVESFLIKEIPPKKRKWQY